MGWWRHCSARRCSRFRWNCRVVPHRLNSPARHRCKEWCRAGYRVHWHHSHLPTGCRMAGGYDASALDNQPYTTLYIYDALGNLTCVEQHGNSSGTGCSAAPSNDATSPWRVRRFTYDSLSRLLTARNPESGAITYTYDNDGELLQKASPAPNQTGPATQTVSYCYDEP